jgi:hypothetical protein
MASNIDLASLTLSQGFSITGVSSGVKSGYSVAIAGDFNGDGYADIIIGAPGYNEKGQGITSYAGISYIIFGKENSFNNINLDTLSTSEGLSIIGTSWGSLGDGSGYSVSAAGDVNNDGYSDVIIGAPYKFVNQNNDGSAYVIFGNPHISNINIASLENSQGFLFKGNGAQQPKTGYSVGGNGDINNDGYDDIIVVAATESGTYYDSFYGACYVMFSQDSLVNINIGGDEFFPTESRPATAFKIVGGAKIAISTAKIAGDINNDGYSDIIVGSITANAAGAAYIIYGKATGGYLRLEDLTPKQGFKIDNYFDYSGYSVDRAGDFNADGYDDVIIGSPFANGGKGAAYVVFGGAVGVNIDLHNLHFTQGFSIQGSKNNDNLGHSVSHAGDVNGDGYDDVIIGASNPNTDSGISYVIFGRRANVNIDLAKLAVSQGFSIIGAGHSVSGAGDINGDGIDDVIIGSPNQNSDAGISYVIFGNSDSEANNDPKTANPSIQLTAIPTKVEESLDLVSSSPTPSIFSPIPIYVTVEIKFGGFYKYTDDILGNGNFIIDSPTNVVVTTGGGADMFTIIPHPGVITTITNFDPSCEIIDLSSFSNIRSINDFTITNKNGAVIMLPHGEGIKLLNLIPEDLSAGNFIFSSPSVKVEEHNDSALELGYGAIAGILSGGALLSASVYLLYAKSFHHWPFNQYLLDETSKDYTTIEIAGGTLETNAY